MSTLLQGSELKVGDVIEVWWQPRRDTITRLVPYKGPLENIFSNGAQLAEFAYLKGGMTIDNNETYEVLSR